MRTWKSVLYNDGDPWVKKEGGSFNVTMRAYNWVEVCELIVIFMLYLIGKKKLRFNKYQTIRDDVLAVFKNVRGPAPEKKKSYNLCLSKKACK